MGLISFEDTEGERWRVWQVATPASQAHLMNAHYRQGWLVFEREDGSERRRLSQVPDGWEGFGIERLTQLWAAAVAVLPGRNTPTGQQMAWKHDDLDADAGR